MINLVPWLLPQPFEVKEIIPEKRLSWYHRELNHNPHQARAQKGALQLLQPIFFSQQHIRHMEQSFHQDSLSNCPPSNLHPADQCRNVILHILGIKQYILQHIIAYHHGRFNAFHKFSIAIIHHDRTLRILHLNIEG